MRADGSTALRAAAYVLVAPSRWDAIDLLVAGGVAAGTVGSYLLDVEASDLMERNLSSFNDDLTNIAVEYGSGYLAIGLPVVMYTYGFVSKDNWVRETAVLMGTAVLLTSATITIGKIVIGRARPYTGLGRHEFKPFKGWADFMSFPSGHTMVAFALSAVLAARIKNPWASVGLYGAATAAAVTRMYSRDHWLSDLVFTAAYTTVVAHSIVDWFENGERSGEPKSRLNVVPTVNGVSVVWRF